MARYLALDALRGLTIAAMILVNTPGSWSSVYAPLLHADWHGCTPTDLVFPFFLFIVGSAMYFSFSKLDAGLTQSQVLRIVKRGAIIFLIGLLLNAYPFVGPLSELRIMGVLQRIGLAYIVAALIVLAFARRGIWIAAISILLTYWGVFLLQTDTDPYALTTNWVSQIDLAVLGASHVWQGKGTPFDPEGIFSTLPAVVNVLFGYEVTRVLTSQSDKQKAIKQMVTIGLVAIAIGWLWGLVMPINKSLWTSSFVVYTSGFACLVLALFIYIIDVKQQHKLTHPFVVYGSNPLFIYVLSWLWATTYYYISIGDTNMYQWLYQQLSLVFDPYLASFVFAISHVVLFWYLSAQLYKRKIFIKI